MKRDPHGTWTRIGLGAAAVGVTLLATVALERPGADVLARLRRLARSTNPRPSPAVVVARPVVARPAVAPRPVLAPVAPPLPRRTIPFHQRRAFECLACGQG